MIAAKSKYDVQRTLANPANKSFTVRVDLFLTRIPATCAVVDVAFTAGPLRVAELVLTLIPIDRFELRIFRNSNPIPGGDFPENRPILSTEQVGDDLDPVEARDGIGEPTEQQGSQCDEAASKCW